MSSGSGSSPCDTLLLLLVPGYMDAISSALACSCCNWASAFTARWLAIFTCRRVGHPVNSGEEGRQKGVAQEAGSPHFLLEGLMAAFLGHQPCAKLADIILHRHLAATVAAVGQTERGAAPWSVVFCCTFWLEPAAASCSPGEGLPVSGRDFRRSTAGEVCCVDACGVPHTVQSLFRNFRARRDRL